MGHYPRSKGEGDTSNSDSIKVLAPTAYWKSIEF